MKKKKSEESANERTVPGARYMFALEVALKACPKGDAAAKLSHVMFIDSRVICSDGDRWHVGRMPSSFRQVAPFAASRNSVQELLWLCGMAKKIASSRSTQWFVHMDRHEIVIQFGDGDYDKLHFRLQTLPVGYVPTEWTEPVPPDAPRSDSDPSGAELRTLHISDFVSIGNTGTFTWRSLGGSAPTRIDRFVGGEHVATAFLLPADTAPAQLAPDEPLMDRVNGAKPRGQSILDLQLNFKLPPTPTTIKIGDVEFNTTGLVDIQDLLRTGPCKHRDTDQECVPCTEKAIEEARAAQLTEAQKVVPLHPSVQTEEETPSTH